MCLLLDRFRSDQTISYPSIFYPCLNNSMIKLINLFLYLLSLILFIYVWSILPDVDDRSALFVVILLIVVVVVGGASFRFGFPHDKNTVCINRLRRHKRWWRNRGTIRRMVSIKWKACHNNHVGTKKIKWIN